MAEAKSSTKKTAKKAGRLAILAAMGPGLLTAMAGNDAGGIATYSSTGATYGYGMLWTVPLMCVLLIVAQETAARMGCATGKALRRSSASSLAYASRPSPCSRLSSPTLR